MKRRWSLILILAFCILALAGCERQEEDDEEEYIVYYVNTEETRLVESPYVPTSQTFDGIMEELSEQLANPPAGVTSALFGDAEILGYQRGIDALRVDFSKEYYDLTNTEEVLLRAAAVKTFVQVPGVIKVMITVEGEQLEDLDGQLVPAMDGDSFIDTKEGGINSYQDASLSLYFAGEDGQVVRLDHKKDQLPAGGLGAVSGELADPHELTGILPLPQFFFLHSIQWFSPIHNTAVSRPESTRHSGGSPGCWPPPTECSGKHRGR